MKIVCEHIRRQESSVAKHRAGIETIARGVLVRRGAVLLCRADAGYCYLPGGHVEFHESACIALAREFREETGLRVRVGRFIAAHELRFRQRGTPRHELSLLFHVEHTRPFPSIVRSREHGITFEWVRPSEFDTLSIRPSHVVSTLRAVLAGRVTPAWESHGLK